MAIVTISRGSFSGGKTLAEHLAERLGQPVLSREQLLLETAERFGIHEPELTRALNESPPFWQQVPGKRLAYVKCVTAVLLDKLADRNLIYHGHVGHLLLSGLPQVIRVRVIADPEYRIAAAMKHLGGSREDALAHIRRVDEDRARWARLLYGVDWEDPRQYGLVVNLSQVDEGAACELIVKLVELNSDRSQPDTEKRYADARLSCRVWAALAQSPETRSANLDVKAENGTVWIRGSVGSIEAARLIPQIAGAVEGVKSVTNEAGVGTDWYW